MAKIKFELYTKGSVLYFKILEQDKRFTSRSSSDYTYGYRALSNNSLVSTHFNKFIIRSEAYPDLHIEALFIIINLRGYVTYENNDLVKRTFSSDKEAEHIKKCILFALKDWAKNAPEFAEGKDTIKDVVPCKERDIDKISNIKVYTL